MVEQRGLPLGAIVTLRARRRGSFGKLLPVDIFVAVFAFGRRRLEIHINELRPQIRRLVAIDTRGGAMRAQQRKRRLGVIESRELLPRLGRVAGFAARWCSAGSHLQHALVELAFVRIGMAAGATQIFPVIDSAGLRLELSRHLVAIATRNRNVTAGEGEVSLSVIG